MTLRIANTLLLALMLGASAPRRGDPKPFTASEFAALIARVSEEGGSFWNDNYVSNEASYLHPLGKLRELGIEGGVYLGVGPNQNLTYIAKLRPRYAFIIDIRRQNFLEHLLFKALFHFSRTRPEYLSMLLSRPLEGLDAPGSDAGIEEMVPYFHRADASPSLYRRNQARIRLFLTQASRLGLSDADLGVIEKIHRAFYIRGLSIKYDYIPVPTYGEFLLERDLDGKRQNFLNSSAEFRFIKRLHEENRIVPLVGDFAGSHALSELGRFLRERGEEVTVFYTSNVEQYLVRSDTWPRFLDNVAQLPLDDRAVFIRAYWSSSTPHPAGEPGYRFTQVLQWVKPFLRSVDPTRKLNTSNRDLGHDQAPLSSEQAQNVLDSIDVRVPLGHELLDAAAAHRRDPFEVPRAVCDQFVRLGVVGDLPVEERVDRAGIRQPQVAVADVLEDPTGYVPVVALPSSLDRGREMRPADVGDVLLGRRALLHLDESDAGDATRARESPDLRIVAENAPADRTHPVAAALARGRRGHEVGRLDLVGQEVRRPGLEQDTLRWVVPLAAAEALERARTLEIEHAVGVDLQVEEGDAGRHVFPRRAVVQDVLGARHQRDPPVDLALGQEDAVENVAAGLREPLTQSTSNPRYSKARANPAWM